MRARPRRRAARGYLLVLVAICVSILSLSYLKLAAAAAISDDFAENEAARLAARYAAESGLVLAEQKLASLKSAPSSGSWLSGELLNARFKVSVSTEGSPKGIFRVISVGTSPGEAGALVTRTMEGVVKPGPGKTWRVVERVETY